MQYRVLGRTGLQVSEIGVGGAQFGLTNYMGRWDAFSEAAERDTTATIHRALELGYTYFDTAPGYGDGRSEEMVGRALVGHRDKVVLATKVSHGQWSPDAIRRSIEASLCRLRTDVIDIIQFRGGWYHQQDVDVIPMTRCSASTRCSRIATSAISGSRVSSAATSARCLLALP